MEKLSDDCLDKIKFLQFRGIIIKEGLGTIVDSIQTLERYKEMLSTIDFVIYHDNHFFLLRNFSSKTLSLLRECSVKFSTKGNIREQENEIVGDLNSLSLIVDKEECIEDYFILEKKLRFNLPKTNDDIINSMAGDYNVVYQILNAAITDKHLKNVSCRQFVETTAFLLASIPELYEDCPLAIPMSQEYLKEVPKVKDLRLKRCINEVQKELKTF